MAKIGILGGTFNPIHLGHIALAKAAYEELKLDKVFIMPTGLSYLKMDQKVLSKETRAEMVKLAIKDIDYFEFSDIEIKKEGNTYTSETLEDLHKLYPLDTFYYLIGADTLFSIERWKNPDIIFNLSVLAVMKRDDADFDDIKRQIAHLNSLYNASIEIINNPKINISSTYIRNEIANNNYEKIQHMLNKEVLAYIKQNNIYN